MTTLAAQLALGQRTEREIVLAIVSPSELDVWRRFALGEKREYIAASRGVAVKTVDDQLAKAKRKVGAKCAQDLVRAAVRYGVITVEVVN